MLPALWWIAEIFGDVPAFASAWICRPVVLKQSWVISFITTGLAMLNRGRQFAINLTVQPQWHRVISLAAATRWHRVTIGHQDSREPSQINHTSCSSHAASQVRFSYNHFKHVRLNADLWSGPINHRMKRVTYLAVTQEWNSFATSMSCDLRQPDLNILSWVSGGWWLCIGNKCNWRLKIR